MRSAAGAEALEAPASNELHIEAAARIAKHCSQKFCRPGHSWLLCAQVTCWSGPALWARYLIQQAARRVWLLCWWLQNLSWRPLPLLPRMMHTAVCKAVIWSRIRSSLNTHGHRTRLCGTSRHSKIPDAIKAASENNFVKYKLDWERYLMQCWINPTWWNAFIVQNCE